jgi:hypothetical protein
MPGSASASASTFSTRWTWRLTTRVVMPLTPVHGSWMKHVEQWFSILQRKRLRIADFAFTDHRRAQVDQFLKEWNQHAHPCNWSTTSVAKIMAEAPALAA